MKKYRLYIDEYGTTGYSEKSEKYLWLLGVILEKEESVKLKEKITNFKIKHLENYDPHNQTNLHWVEIIKNFQKSEEFINNWSEIINELDFQIIIIGINKENHFNRYDSNWKFNTYEYLLNCMIERYCKFLIPYGNQGDIVCETRGESENKGIEREFSKIYHNGINMGKNTFLESKSVKKCITSNKIKIHLKKDCIAGLEIADFLAKPTARLIMEIKNLVYEKDKKIKYPKEDLYKKCKGKIKTSFLKGENGRVEGVGVKIL